MWKSAILFVVTLHCALAEVSDEAWAVYKKEYGKKYKSAREESMRRAIWTQRTNLIQVHNEAADRGRSSYWMGMNQFGDMTKEELRSFTTGIPRNRTENQLTVQKRNLYASKKRTEALPAEVDWRKKGAVTKVVSQGMCGSSPYFAAAGSLEGQFAIKTGKLPVVSVQNLLDCSYKQGNFGCAGGYPDNCFQYVADNQGVDSNQSYPYEAVSRTCRFVRSGVVGTDMGFTNIPKGDEDSLQRAVADVGPIANAVDAHLESFSFYKSGVYDDPNCSSTMVDHGIVVVGYGTDISSGKEYWLLKNTYGLNWGMKGYIWIARNNGNRCGVATLASFPLV